VALLVEADALPAVVLGAIRQAPGINDDPAIRNLRDTDGPADSRTEAPVTRSRSPCYPFRPYLG
jgi:hypothetical protein